MHNEARGCRLRNAGVTLRVLAEKKKDQEITQGTGMGVHIMNMKARISDYRRVYMRAYVGHSLVAQSVELRVVAVDGPHGHVLPRPEPVIRLQGEVVVPAEGLQVYLLLPRLRAPPVHRVQHGHDLVRWN